MVFRRPEMRLEQFRLWVRADQQAKNRAQAERSAEADYLYMFGGIIEATAVQRGIVDGTYETFTTPKGGLPFVLQVERTPPEMLKRWDPTAGGNVLDPVWVVKVLNARGQKRLLSPGKRSAWVFVRSYQLPPEADFGAMPQVQRPSVLVPG